MAAKGNAYRFGPFIVHATHRRVYKDGDDLHLPSYAVDLLICFAEHGNDLVGIDTLLGVMRKHGVTSREGLAAMIEHVNDSLGKAPGGHDYIQFNADYSDLAPHKARPASVEADGPRELNESLATILATFPGFATGQAVLEPIDPQQVNRALGVFVALINAHPASVEARLGLANACVLAFVTTLPERPNFPLLQEAENQAERAVRLDETAADAWGTLAVVRHQLGDAQAAQTAARKAVSLEPENWRHHLRHAAVSWGQERIDAAARALAMNPELGLARFFIATVHIARGHFETALAELRGNSMRGFHWLTGLILEASGRADDLIDDSEFEYALHDGPHVYVANSADAYAYALVCQAQRMVQQLEATSADGISYIDAAKSLLSIDELPPGPPMCAWYGCGDVADGVTRAMDFVREGRIPAAVEACRDALRAAPPSPADWLIPVDPLLDVAANPQEWESVLSLVRTRAM